MHYPAKVLISRITPWVYLGNWHAASCIDLLSNEDYQIKRIVSVTDDPRHRPSSEFCAQNNIEQIIFPIPYNFKFVDTEHVVLTSILPWIKEAEEESIPVLIHCQAGVSRSASLTLTYLIWRGMPIDKVFLHLFASHPIAAPDFRTLSAFFACISHEPPDAYRFLLLWRRSQSWFQRHIFTEEA